MLMATRTCIVETDWLEAHLNAPDLIVLDGSWYMPAENRDPRAEFLEERIPGALFFDIDELSDSSTDLPHMLPSATLFASRMKKAGIGDGMRIVVYDSAGLFSAARVWWMLRAMGHEEVAVLNGGLPKWKAEKRPLEDGPVRVRTPRHFTARLNASLVRDLADMQALLSTPGAQIVDARSAARFEGRQPEPRAGLRSGHMPGARNIPFNEVLNPDGTLKPKEELSRIFREAGVDVAQPVVTTCGSGVTAAVLALALAITGNRDAAVYDGSWAEWGQDNGLPVVTGPAT